MNWNKHDFDEYRCFGQNGVYNMLHVEAHNVNHIVMRLSLLPSLQMYNPTDSYTLLIDFYQSSFQFAAQKI